MSLGTQDLFVQLDREWAQSVQRPLAARDLIRWQNAEPVLNGIDDLGLLLLALQGRSEPSRRDERMRAVLRLAATDPSARRFVLQVIRPALSRLAHSYDCHWGREGSAAMVMVTALERIATFPVVNSRTNIAGHLVRDIGRVLFRKMQREAKLGVVLGEQVNLKRAASVAPTPSITAAEQVVTLVAAAVASGRLSHRHLIEAQRVLGLTTAEVAEAEGRNCVAVRTMRRQPEINPVAAVTVA